MTPSSPAWALFAVEMRMLARDRRTLFASVLLPLLVMPLFFVLARAGEQQRQERSASRVLEYAVTGSLAEQARRLLALAEAGEATVTLAEKQLDEKELEAGIVAALDGGRVHAVLEALPLAEAAALERRSTGPRGDAAAELPLLRLHFTADWEKSTAAVGELERRLAAALLEHRDHLLEEAGSDLRRDRLVPIAEVRDVATAGERTGAAIGRWAPIFMMLFLLVGGSVVAADTLAGEKERGTLETVLTTAAARHEILLAKLLAIFTVGLLITLVQLLNIGLYAGLRWIEVPADFAIDANPAAALWLLLLFAAFALLVSATLLWVSGRSPTYKSFQVALLPVLLLLLAPAAAPFLPGLELRSVLAAVPLAGAAVAVREVLSGRFDLAFLALSVLVTLAAALMIARAALKDLSGERLLAAGRGPGHAVHGGAFELFERRAPLYFAAGWVLIFLSSGLFGFGLRGQVLFNVVGVFLGGSLWLIRRYRLEPRALGLRRVCAPVWAGVCLGAPATFLVGAAVARLSSQLFPLPERVLEAFARGLVPPDMPLAELLFLVAVLPGICEEVAFRGVLLHALRRRLGSVSLAATTAAAFALFHFEWVRLLPTFLLGLLLAALVLRTGSLLPAMLWHVLNNASAILAERIGLDAASLGSAAYAWAAAAAVLAWCLVWRGSGPDPARRTGRSG